MKRPRPALKRPHPPLTRRVVSWKQFLVALCEGPLDNVRAIPGRVHGGWQTQPRLEPTYDVHYLWCAPQAALEVNLLGGPRRFEPGVLVWVPPGVPYEVHVRSRRRTEFLHRLRFAVRRRGRHLTPLADVTAVPEAGFAGDLVYRVATEDARDDVAAAHRLRCVIGLLAGEVCDRLHSQPDSGPGLSPAQVAFFRSLVAGDPGGRPTVAQLAARVGYAPGYFTRLFTSAAGMPPRRWLVCERIKLAGERLLETRRPVTDVALEFGYDNPFLFSRQFRDVMGCSPTAWRERHR